MKSFVYMARDVSGALRRGSIGVADRAAALAALKARGLTPVSVAEGSVPRRVNRRRTLSVFAALLGATGCVVLMVVLLKQRPKVKPVAVAEATKGIVRTQRAKMANAPEEKDLAVTHGAQAVPGKAGAVPPPMSSKPPPVPPQPAKAARVTTSGAANTPANNPRQTFTTGTEQVVSWIANSRLGDPPPILPMLPMVENIEKILNTDIVLYDDDDGRTEAVKANVAKMKQAMKAFVAEGGDPQEFLQFYQDELKAAHEEWRTSQAELMKKIREDDKRGAAVFLEERNKELEAKGIKPLAVPPFLMNNLGR
jgi:hypothetical protein